MPISIDRRLIGVLAVWVLSGCATTKEAVIPQDGPDMRTLYESHLRAAGTPGRLAAARGEVAARPTARGGADLRAFTREAATEIDQVFALLANPQLVLYVFAHLSGEGAPVPGYATAFPMYAVDQYALPGELSAP